MNRLPGEELVALGEVAAAEEAPVRAQRRRVRGPGRQNEGKINLF